VWQDREAPRMRYGWNIFSIELPLITWEDEEVLTMTSEEKRKVVASPPKR